jgi:3'-5' exoribonuclease
MDEITNLDLPALPTVFRLTSYTAKVLDHKRTECTATLFHEKVSMKVRWTTASPDTRMKPNRLVSPRWSAQRGCDEEGKLRISRLVLIERPEAMENLFETVPSGWVRDRKLVGAARNLIEVLPRGHRHLFNAIFWDGERFRRFCMGPSSMKGHHNGENGNLVHAIDVATMMREWSGRRDIASTPLGVLAGLLHDAGKADEYRLKPDGGWALTDRGRLLGHKITNIEWIVTAMTNHRIVLPCGHYEGLLHCLTASKGAPEWLGIRKPAMLEAIMLSDLDRFSGTEDLMVRCAANDGWGVFHPHLSSVPYAVL